ncbi:MAG: hypothetical protein KGI04_03805 [Candidatus Micrarchaeota archaeon]|nr:hypothetical protein [Candidatus Micrarchaeota archaeon]
MRARSTNPAVFKSRPVLHVCSSKRSINELVESSKRLVRGGDVLLLFRYDERLVRRVLPAYVNAALRFGEGSSRSNSMQVEMLLFLCGTMNIGKALRECGAADSKRFCVFSSSAALFSRFSKANGIVSTRRIPVSLDPKVSGNVAISELLSD